METLQLVTWQWDVLAEPAGMTAVYRFEDGDLFFDLADGAGIMRLKKLVE